jgi:hypothetical protein
MFGRITVISDERTYFFSTDHCQEHGLGENFVPCTHSIPSWVYPRECVPDGWINTKEQLVSVFYHDMKEIPNPDPRYQP